MLGMVASRRQDLERSGYLEPAASDASCSGSRNRPRLRGEGKVMRLMHLIMARRAYNRAWDLKYANAPHAVIEAEFMRFQKHRCRSGWFYRWTIPE